MEAYTTKRGKGRAFESLVGCYQCDKELSLTADFYKT